MATKMPFKMLSCSLHSDCARYRIFVTESCTGHLGLRGIEAGINKVEHAVDEQMGLHFFDCS